MPADHLTLALAPTRRIEGTVQLGATPRTQLLVTVMALGATTQRYLLFAPIRPDGTFVVDGAPTERLQIGLGRFSAFRTSNVHYQEVPASRGPVTGVVLALGTSARALDIVVRSTLSTPLPAAQVMVFSGRVQPKNVAELVHKVQPGDMQSGFAQPATGPAGSASRTGDLVMHFTDVHAGELTVCAIALAGDFGDSAANAKIQAHLAELEIRCEQLSADATSVVIEAPPQKRFD